MLNGNPDDDFKQPETATKPKRKGNGKNSPVIGDNGFMTKPGDNAKMLSDMLYIYNMPPIDINSDDAVKDRIHEYFTYCIEKDMKPGVEGMCMALGISRSTLWDWEVGRSRSEPNGSRSDIIKKSKQFLAQYLEGLAQNGKINPVTAIFMLKNHFNYKDSQDINIVPNNPNDDAIPFDDLKKLADQHHKSYVVDGEAKEV
jgi:hypothetical protein